MNILPLPEKNSTGPAGDTAPVRVAVRWYFLAPAIALLGGVFGIIGAFFAEIRYASLLLVYIGVPVIEESLKPCGVYLLLAKWPHALRSRLYTAFLSALGGVAFAVIENIVYLTVYIPDAGADLILWRYTVGLGVHTAASFIFGFGINQELLDSVNGIRKFLTTGKRYFFTAIALHAVYNIAVTIFAGNLGF
jgi:RsiW-degrading membrane proteinase PrsW (M82 family)